MGKMLINARDNQELRVALVDEDDGYLCDLDIEPLGFPKKKSNIYKGYITRIEQSLGAVFVDYGADKQGFLPLKEIDSIYFSKSARDNYDQKPSVRELLREGQELIVQIDKEERGTKGAALTTFLALAGRYLVLMPNSPGAGGISRRIEGEEREDMRDVLNELNIPEGMGIIIRTAGMGKAKEDLQWDLEILLNQYRVIKQLSETRPSPSLIHQEGDVIIRSIRDNLRKGIGEIVIDDLDAFKKAKEFIQEIDPGFLSQVKLYQGEISLLEPYENQINTAYQRVVLLPSGGSIVIDSSEALVSIDVNSAKATAADDIESTALNTNLEAAKEITRQMRIRDLGGLIVIDFIDMLNARNQREVENQMRDLVKLDRARVQMARISRFGLMEMSRQRLRLPLIDRAQKICDRCDGRGSVRSVQSLGSAVIRLIERAALKSNASMIHAQLPVPLATFIFNEKRSSLSSIEQRCRVQVVIIPNPYLDLPHYKIAALESEEKSGTEDGIQDRPLSYEWVDVPEISIPEYKKQAINQIPDSVYLSAKSKTESNDVDRGLLYKIWHKLFGSSQKQVKKSSEKDSLPANKDLETNVRTDRAEQRGGRSPSSSPRSPSGTRRRGHMNRMRSNNSRRSPLSTSQANASTPVTSSSSSPRQQEPSASTTPPSDGNK